MACFMRFGKISKVVRRRVVVLQTANPMSSTKVKVFLEEFQKYLVIE